MFYKPISASSCVYSQFGTLFSSPTKCLHIENDVCEETERRVGVGVVCGWGEACNREMEMSLQEEKLWQRNVTMIIKKK